MRRQLAKQNKLARAEEAGGKWEPAYALLVGMYDGEAAVGKKQRPCSEQKGTALSGGPTVLLLDPYLKE